MPQRVALAQHPPVTAPKASLSHRLETLAYRAFGGLLGRLPMDSCVTLGELLGSLAHALTPGYRGLVRRNLRIATAAEPLTDAALDALVRETFRRAGGNFLAALKTESMPAADLAHHFDATALAAVRPGTVLAMAHMGNWEALPRLASLILPSGSYGGVYRPLNNPLMDTLTRERRTSGGARLFSRTDGFHAPAAFLKDGGILGVLADHRAGARGFPMPFFGKLTTCSPLPDLLARRSKSHIATLHTRATSTGKWSLVVKPLPTATDTPGIMAGIESMMRAEIADVFWFHDRWKIDALNPLSLYTRLDPATARRATVPLRLVLTTAPDADETGVQAMLHAMMESRPDLRIDRLATPAAESRDPRVILHPWDRDAPPEHAEALLRRIDAAHPAPLDGAILFGSEPSLARTARAAGLRCIIGINVAGKPWSRSLTPPKGIAEWAAVAHELCWIPDRYRS